MRSWYARHKFPVLASLAIVFLQVAVSAMLATNVPAGRVWTGMGWQFANDQAIYLGYVEQIRSGALGLRSLSLPMPQIPFWHPAYVAVGMFARATSLSSPAAYRLSLWIASAVSVFLIHSVSRALARNERDASTATMLILFSGGLGWIGLLLSTLAHAPALGWGVADMWSEAFFFESIFTGPHIPLSIALFPFAMIRIWKESVEMAPIAERVTGWSAILSLVLIHPYVVPILIFFLLIVWVRNKQESVFRSMNRSLPTLFAIAIGALPHAWGQFANEASRGLLLKNDLPIAPVWLWVVVFAPWLAVAGVRILRKIPVEKKELWIPIWIAASFLAIALPFKWDNKLAISWHAALVWFGLPVIMQIRDKVLRTSFLKMACLFFLSISSLYVLTQQIPYARGGISDRLPMYVSVSDMSAWTWARAHTKKNSFVLPADPFMAIWAPPFMQRSVWIGHPMDTPDYEAKKDVLPNIRTMTPSNLADFLTMEKIDVILTSDDIQTRQFLERLGPDWRLGASFDGHGVFVRD